MALGLSLLSEGLPLTFMELYCLQLKRRKAWGRAAETLPHQPQAADVSFASLMHQNTGQNKIQTHLAYSKQAEHMARNSIKIRKYQILFFPFREQMHTISMALTSATFHNSGLSHFPLSSLTTDQDCFQILLEEMVGKVGTCALMQKGLSVALIKAKEKQQPYLMSLLLLTQSNGSLGN